MVGLMVDNQKHDGQVAHWWLILPMKSGDFPLFTMNIMEIGDFMEYMKNGHSAIANHNQKVYYY